MSNERQALIEKTRASFDKVRSILGDKILPSYPVFILSIMQSLENSSLDLKETSYGYCYQSLIHFALVNKAGVGNDDLGSYINLLKELSFFLFKQETELINEGMFLNFYKEYSERFIISRYDVVKKVLLDSRLIKYEDNHYKFIYEYILYFLIAKHISEVINTYDGKNILKYLFDGMHSDKNAKILVFITHHSKDISFIHDSLLSAMLPFEDVSPITLDKNSEHSQYVLDIGEEISHNIIEQNRVPEEEREKFLIAHDNANKHTDKSNADTIPNEVNEAVAPFLQAFRSIDIVGQIVKNRRGSLEKSDLVDLRSLTLYST